MESGAVIPNVKKIAVLRALVLGDLIFALPAFDALHRTYPDAEIIYLGRPWHAEFIPGRIPGVARVVTFLPADESYADLGFLIHPDAAEDVFTRLQAEQIDLAIQMQGGGYSSNPFIQRLNARVSIGLRERGAIALDRWARYQYHQNEVIRQLDLVALAGAKTTEPHPRLTVLEKDHAAAAPYLAGIRRPYAVLHTGARDVRRQWSTEHFIQVADEVKRRFNLEVVLTGTSEADVQRTQWIETRMQEGAVNLAGKISIEALIGILNGAALVISNDTGPLHLAIALGVPTVGLFWVEYLIKSMPLTRQFFTPLIAWNRHCPLCGLYMDHYEVVSCDPRPCMHETSFLESISADEVMEAVEELLSKGVLPRVEGRPGLKT